MQHEAIAAETAAEPAAAPTGALSAPGRILALQRTAGNRAVGQTLARAEKTKPWFGDPPALPARDWYAEDRAANTGTWHTANEIVTLSAASEGILGSGVNELQGMMREGNQVIFDNVFPKLRALYDSPTPITGQAAIDWDAKTLSEEQNLVQPLYGSASSDARKLLEGIAKDDWATQLGSVFSSADTVQKGQNIAPGDVPYFDKAGDLQDVSQRYAYRMKLASQFSTIKPSGTVPTSALTPEAAYLDGSALRAVDTRRNLHFVDAIIDSTMSPPEQEQLVHRLALLTTPERARFLSGYADRIARAGIFPYRLLEGLAFWDHDLAEQLSFVDEVLKKISYPWVDIKYEWVKPMIKRASSPKRMKISGSRWKKIFIDICDDDDIDAAVADLELGEEERKEWVAEEKSIF